MQATIHDIERLFGTSDLNALEQIARKWAAAGANPRGAGRKKKFALDEVVAMKAMQQDGATEAQLAKQYKTSRQTISANFRRLYDFSEHPTADSRIFYMHGDTLCTVIDVDHRNEMVYVKDFHEKPLLTAFGKRMRRPGRITSSSLQNAVSRKAGRTAARSCAIWGLIFSIPKPSPGRHAAEWPGTGTGCSGYKTRKRSDNLLPKSNLPPVCCVSKSADMTLISKNEKNKPGHLHPYG